MRNGHEKMQENWRNCNEGLRNSHLLPNIIAMTQPSKMRGDRLRHSWKME
jgi:hypothetical protein